MELSLACSLLIVRCIANVMGIFPSAFITSFNVLTWTNGGNLNTCDYILLAVGTSGVLFQSARIADNCFFILGDYFNDMAFQVRLVVQVVLWTGSSNFWLKTCLCAYYCVKIVELNSQLLFWLKLRISRMVPPLLLGSFVGSLVLSIPSYWKIHSEFPQNPSSNLTANCSLRYCQNIMKLSHSYNVASSALGFCLPVALDMVSITLIIMSLFRHARRMKESTSGFCQPRIEAHVGAIKMVVSLLLANILFIVSEGVSIHSTDSLLEAVFEVILAFIMPAPYIILISGNSKLRQAFWKVLLVLRSKTLTK